MKIKIEDGKAHVYTPYHTDFVSKIKKIGSAKWDSYDRCWIVDETEVDVVRGIMEEIWGESDIPSASEKVAIKVTFNEEASSWRDSVYLFGIVVARATGRDSGARIGHNATLISGDIGSGGSRSNWETIIKKDTVIKLRNVPKEALSKKPEYNVTVEIIEEEKIDVVKLKEEKEKLLSRLDEINKLLEDLGGALS